MDFVVKRNWIQNVHFLSSAYMNTYTYCQNYFLITSMFETLYFLKSCPIYDELSLIFILKTQRFLSIMLTFGQNFKVNILLLYLFYFIIFTGLLGFKETYWFCRFEKPRSHLLHEQFAASPIFYQQPTQICLQNAYWGRRQVIYQGVLTRKPLLDRQLQLV